MRDVTRPTIEYNLKGFIFLPLEVLANINIVQGLNKLVLSSAIQHFTNGGDLQRGIQYVSARIGIREAAYWWRAGLRGCR